MNEFKIGDLVVAKSAGALQIGVIVSFYGDGSYSSNPTDLAVIASADRPFIGAPHPIIHISLLNHHEKAKPSAMFT